MDKFSDFIIREKDFASKKKDDDKKNKSLHGKKDNDPRVKSAKSNYSNFLGAKGHKKKFEPRKKVARSNYDKSIGRRKRGGGKTKMARTILAKKLGVKKAIHKDENSKYVIKHLDIQSMMRKFGYIYDSKHFRWVKKEDTKNSADSSNKSNGSSSTETPSNISNDIPQSGSIMDIEKDDDDEVDIITDAKGNKIDANETKFTAIGNGGIEYDVSEDDIRSYSARLMLALFFDMPSALKFEEAEEEDEDVGDNSKAISVYVDPVIPRDKVVDKIENLGYSWSVDNQDWRKNDISIFDEFAKDESSEQKDVMMGRIYLSILGFLYAVEFVNNEPTMAKEDVLENMSVLGFIFNKETNTWEHGNG